MSVLSLANLKREHLMDSVHSIDPHSIKSKKTSLKTNQYSSNDRLYRYRRYIGGEILMGLV